MTTCSSAPRGGGAPIPHVKGAPIGAGVPRPMSGGNLGAPAKAVPSAPTAAWAPVIQTNSRTAGAAVPAAKPQHHMPLPTAQRAPSPAPPLKRKHVEPSTAISPAKRHAPSPSPRGLGTRMGGVPLPTIPPAVAAQAARPAPMPSPHAQGAPTGGAPGHAVTPSPAPQWRYLGVHQNPSGQWMARVLDPKQRVPRDIGPFQDEHAAALAHDRVAVAAHGDGGAPLNFRAAFHRIEQEFLRRCLTMENIGRDLCGIIEKGTYEAWYAEFLKEVYRRVIFPDHRSDIGDDFLDVILDFFIARPKEIGREALEAGGDKLVRRFVEMHRNRALSPVWRKWYHQQQVRLQQRMMVQNQKMQQQQQCVDGNGMHAEQEA